MKKIKIILFFLFSASILSSCFKDKGNYDYTGIGSLEIGNIEEMYTVTSMVDVLDIKPEIESTIQGDEYEYVWGIYPITNGQQKIDTVGREKDLHYLVNLPAGSFYLFLHAKNVKTGISKYHQTTIQVVTEYTEGWYIMKDENNKSDIDIHISESKIIRDILNATTGRSLDGTVQGLYMTSGYSWVNYGPPVVTNSKKRIICPITTQEAGQYLIDNMSLIHDYKNMFYSTVNEDVKPLTYTLAASFVLFTTKGLYGYSSMTPPGAGKFGTPVQFESKVVIPEKYITSTAAYILFYDKENCRFLTSDSNLNIYKFGDKDSQDQEAPMLPREMNSDLIFSCSQNRTVAGSTSYVLMKRRDNQEMYVLKMDLKALGKYYNPIQEVQKIAPELKINSATVFGHQYLDPIFYYSNDNNLHMYNCNGKTEVASIYSFPANEKIAFIKNICYNAPASDIENKFDYLIIGTQVGENYNVYLFNHLAGRPSGEAVKILKGKGRAMDAQYVNPYFTERNYTLI